MADPRDSWDPLHTRSAPHLHWSTDNVGEAAPGVLTPLSWSLWGPVGDRMPRRIGRTMGILTRGEGETPPVGERIVEVFYGRIAMQMEYMATVGDRLPGTSGRDAVEALFGKVPDGMEFRPTRRRYPAIAMRLPLCFATSPGKVRRLARETDAWWREQLPRLGTLDLAGALATFEQAADRFDHTLTVHSLGLLSTVQPLYDALSKLVESTGVGDVGVLSGSGGAEMAIVEDIWRASRGRIGLDEVIRNHGFHGPLEGELSSRVWREDPEPLRRAVREYATRDDADDPGRREEESRRRALEIRRELVAAVPAARRPATSALLGLAATRIPLRGVGKRSFLQAFDVARGAARRAGECLAADGVLDHPEDVFYLTADELTGALPDGAGDLVAWRRVRRAEYEQLAIPGNWKGTPVPTRIDTGAADEDGQPPDVVEGIGVSAGVAEGVVRIVTDPTFADVEQDEVLVAPTTDPSWSSIMFVSSALVVDIGGPLSHAAVVARELGLPCVVNTRSGTRALRTGDRVRVDGSKGTVEVLERVAAVTEGSR